MTTTRIFYTIINAAGEFYKFAIEKPYFTSDFLDKAIKKFNNKDEAVKNLMYLKANYPSYFEGAKIESFVISITQDIEDIEDECLKFINLRDLDLPKDVMENSNYVIPLNGKLDMDKNIIVITQLKRRVFEAYVCTLSYGKTSLDTKEKGELVFSTPYIDDIPGYPPMIIGNLLDTSVKTIGGVQYTMVCKDDVDKEYCRPNWLW